MSDDLIKRSDAIGAITNHCENECYYRVDNWCPQCQREEFEEAIKAVPSADRPSAVDLSSVYSTAYKSGYEKGKADRPQGGNLLEKYPSLFECSVCGASCFDTIPWDCNINYCPNCGAKMSNASNASNTLETLEKGETE